MREKEVTVPIRFAFKIGKSQSGCGVLNASISVKTKWPIILAYFYLAGAMVIMGMKRLWA